MATIECTLEKGISIGDTRHVACELKQNSVGDLRKGYKAVQQALPFMAGEDARGLPVMDAKLFVNPQLLTLELLRSRVIKLGDLPMPLEPEQFDKLSEADLGILQHHADLLDGLSMEAELEDRGKSLSASADADTPDQ